MPQTFLQFYRIDEDGEFTRFHCQATLDATLRDLENTIDDFSGEVFTDLTPNEIIYTRVVNGKEAYYGGARVDERGPFNICAFDPTKVPPANNTYQTATTLTMQDGSCTSQTEGDLTYASSTNNINYSSRVCLGYYDGYDITEYAAVWYKAVVPSSGELTIETSGVSGSDTKDTVMVAYTLSEDVLTEIDCNDNFDLATFSRIELSEQTENTEIYVMVVEFSDVNYGDDSKLGPFNICVFDPSTLETPLIKSPLLSYYSNPVGNRLSVESPYDIQSLSVYDLAVREVMRKNPQQQKLTLDTYSLSSGVYLLEVQTAAGAQTVKLVKK